MIVYSGDFYSENEQGYSYSERDVICTNCGEVIDRQIKYNEDLDYNFSNPDKKKYKYCPYCGEKLYEDLK